MSKNCGIYKITSPTGRIYIGQSVNLKKRLSAYKRKDCAKQIKLSASLHKYGWSAHVFEVIENCKRSELNDREVFYMEKYNSLDYMKGLNLREGGDSAPMPLESIKKTAKAQTGVKQKGNASSSYIGVSFDFSLNTWRSQIAIFGKNQKKLGVFDKEIDAAYAYDMAVIKYHNGKTPMNFNDSERAKIAKIAKPRRRARSNKYIGVIKTKLNRYSARATLSVGKIKLLGTYNTALHAAIEREIYILNNKTTSKRNFSDSEMGKFNNIEITKYTTVLDKKTGRFKSKKINYSIKPKDYVGL